MNFRLIFSRPSSPRRIPVWLLMGLLGLVSARVKGAESDAAVRCRKDVQPILAQYCYDCHGDGSAKGGVTLDEFTSEDSLLRDRELWFRVLKNVRSGLMPPNKKPHPTGDERKVLADWIKYGAFG